MACTTILVGKAASYDGSTMIARNDDSGSGHFTAKKFTVIHPEELPKTYRSVLSHVEIPLPEGALRFTAMPNAVEGKGIWAASGVNAANVGMTATETITSNPRVLGADPLVEYQPAKGEKPEVPGGIGEEDIVYLVLPYIHSAREGVLCLGSLLEQYGTYEMNGIAFQDVNEIWWLETIGGHHWIARRVPDDVYVVMPNQLGIDTFDLEDAFGAQENYLCSTDLREFIAKNHLDLSLDGALNPRDAFGSHDDADHVYNTPRAWYMLRYLNPRTWVWEGADADYTPMSDDLPWCMVPERKVTPEDIKYMLSSHYQGTPYDPYLSYGDKSAKGAYRSIGINRNDFMALLQMRPDQPEESRAVEWVAYASNAFNTMADSLETSEQRRNAFIANVSHELKTPMTTIAGFADGILDGTIPKDQEDKYLATIADETRRLSRLVRSMLDMSRLESTGEDLTRRREFDISEKIVSTMLSFEARANDKQLDVDLQLPEDSMQVLADPDAITRVLYNLMDNAVKFAAPGSTLCVSLWKSEGKAYVSVRDHGETIPPDDLTFIFDRFHKSDRSRSLDRDGVGLGLYLVKSILDAHGEDIAVTSRDGVTEFVFTLTLAKPAPKPTAKPESTGRRGGRKSS